MQLLDVRQRNNLLTGNELAAELPPSTSGRRAFIVVGAYREVGIPGGAPVSKYLNSDQSDVRFWLRKYEVDMDSINQGKKLSEEDAYNHVLRTGIPSVAAVEAELAKYLDDFSHLGIARGLPL